MLKGAEDTAVSSVCVLEAEASIGRPQQFSTTGKVVAATDSSIQAAFTCVGNAEPSFDEFGGLCHAVRGGKSTTVVVGNSSSRTYFHELVCHCASQLVSAEKRLTMSWFTMATDKGEHMVDELCTASSATAQTKSAKQPSDLLLRELGFGKGMLVPGLWEIECASGSEVKAVISHVLAKLPHLDQPALERPFHSIFQLTVSDKQPPAAAKKGGAGGKKDFVAAAALVDKTSQGRLTLVQLGALTHAVDLLYTPHVNQVHTASSTGAVAVKPSEGQQASTGAPLPLTSLAFQPWVVHLRTVLLWLQTRQPATPFHRSRLVLLLKDLLLRRQSGAAVLCLAPGDSHAGRSVEWLRLFAQFNALTSVPMPGMVVPARPLSAPRTARSIAPSSPQTQSQPQAETAVPRGRLRSVSSAQSLVGAVRESPTAAGGEEGLREGRSRSASRAGTMASADVQEVGRSRSSSRTGGPRLFRSTVRGSAGSEELAEAVSAAAASIVADAKTQSLTVDVGDDTLHSKGPDKRSGAMPAVSKAGYLTPKQMSTAMKELAKRNKQAALKAAAQAEADLVPPHVMEIRRLKESWAPAAIAASCFYLKYLLTPPYPWDRLAAAEALAGGAQVVEGMAAFKAALAEQERQMALMQEQLQVAQRRIAELTRENQRLQHLQGGAEELPVYSSAADPGSAGVPGSQASQVPPDAGDMPAAVPDPSQEVEELRGSSGPVMLQGLAELREDKESPLSEGVSLGEGQQYLPAPPHPNLRTGGGPDLPVEAHLPVVEEKAQCAKGVGDLLFVTQEDSNCGSQDDEDATLGLSSPQHAAGVFGAPTLQGYAAAREHHDDTGGGAMHIAIQLEEQVVQPVKALISPGAVAVIVPTEAPSATGVPEESTVPSLPAHPGQEEGDGQETSAGVEARLALQEDSPVAGEQDIGDTRHRRCGSPEPLLRESFQQPGLQGVPLEAVLGREGAGDKEQGGQRSTNSSPEGSIASLDSADSSQQIRMAETFGAADVDNA